MMKFILAITLLAAAAMASDDGTSVHGDLIKDYCAADDAGRDAILVAFKDGVSSQLTRKQKLSAMKLGLHLPKLAMTKLYSDRDSLMEFVKRKQITTLR